MARWKITNRDGSVVYYDARTRRDAAAKHAKSFYSTAIAQPEYSNTYWAAFVDGRYVGETYRIDEVPYAK